MADPGFWQGEAAVSRVAKATMVLGLETLGKKCIFLSKLYNVHSGELWCLIAAEAWAHTDGTLHGFESRGQFYVKFAIGASEKVIVGLYPTFFNFRMRWSINHH